MVDKPGDCRGLSVKCAVGGGPGRRPETRVTNFLGHERGSSGLLVVNS